jgi:polar amino acid transport system ATP-binding protein
VTDRNAQLQSVSLAGKDIHLSFGRNTVLRGVDIDARRAARWR